MILLDISPIVFQSQMFWGPISLVQIPRVEVPDVGTNLLLLRENLYLWFLPTVGHHAGVGLMARLHLCLSYSSWCGPFILCCGRAVWLAFRSFSKGIISWAAVDLSSIHGRRWVKNLHMLPSWIISNNVKFLPPPRQSWWILPPWFGV